MCVCICLRDVLRLTFRWVSQRKFHLSFSKEKGQNCFPKKYRADKSLIIRRISRNITVLTEFLNNWEQCLRVQKDKPVTWDASPLKPLKNNTTSTYNQGTLGCISLEHFMSELSMPRLIVPKELVSDRSCQPALMFLSWVSSSSRVRLKKTFCSTSSLLDVSDTAVMWL